MTGAFSQNPPIDPNQVTQFVRCMGTFIPKPRAAPPEAVVRLITQSQPLLSKGKPRLAVSPFNFYLMANVLYRDTKPTMRELSRALSVPLSTASRMVSLWADNGLVRRLSDPDDGRVIRVVLTDNGRCLHDIMEEFLGQHAKTVLACLTAEERIILLTLLSKVTSTLETKPQ